MKKLLLSVITTASLISIGSCISKTNHLMNIEGISKADLDKNLAENIQLVKIKSKDDRGNISECSGMFSGQKTIITLAECVYNAKVTVHGVAPTKIYVSNDYHTPLQSKVNRNALLNLDNLAVLTFEEKVPSPLLFSNTSGNTLTDMLQESSSYYIFQMPRNESQRKGITQNYNKEDSPIRSTSYYFPDQIIKSSPKHFSVESQQIANFKSYFGDAGSPLIHVTGDKVRVVGLGAIIVKGEGYSWPEQFLSMPIDMNNPDMKLLAERVSKDYGASFEYLSR